MIEPSYTLHFAKEDFKFSSAHFTLFGPEKAERLHGHNYQVGLELVGSALDDDGLLVDFARVKGRIRELCDRLDSRTLVPEECPYLGVERGEGVVTVRFRERVYRFPEADTLLLPIANTSIELFARYLWQELRPALAGSHVEALGVNVAETAGQSCWYRARL